jgi:hypothetical protein
MKVSELIVALERYDQSADVVIASTPYRLSPWVDFCPTPINPTTAEVQFTRAVPCRCIVAVLHAQLLAPGLPLGSLGPE